VGEGLDETCDGEEELLEIVNIPAIQVRKQYITCRKYKYRVDFILLDCEAAAMWAASRAPTHCAFAEVVVSEGRSNYPACTYRTPNTNLLFMKRKFMNKSWIIFTPILIVLRIHLSM
jgi:hypothetical protein